MSEPTPKQIRLEVRRARAASVKARDAVVKACAALGSKQHLNVLSWTAEDARAAAELSLSLCRTLEILSRKV
jgi:hypothetical protein